MIILGIETSCDETAAAVIEAEKGKIKVLSNVVSSQVKLHAKWGGVVPNLAAREHLKNILPIVKLSLKEAGISPKDLNLIAVTNGPGLIPALLIGTSTAKTLSYIWRKPLMGIHHIEGHIYANFINPPLPTLSLARRGTKGEVEIKFPILCLVVSGGHTQLVLMKKHLDYKIIGETLDDAAGEAFDKVARILDLGYPGGPAIAKTAEEYTHSTTSASRPPLLFKEGKGVVLPRPMLNSSDFNFSFSGLKTAVLYLVHPVKSAEGSPASQEFNRVKKNEEKLKDKKFIQAVANEFQQAVIDVLVGKTIEASKKYHPKTIMLAGGVSANKELRRQLGEAVRKEFPEISYLIPDITYCVDNATMTATAAYFRWQMTKNKSKLSNNWRNLKTDAGLTL